MGLRDVKPKPIQSANSAVRVEGQGRGEGGGGGQEEGRGRGRRGTRARGHSNRRKYRAAPLHTDGAAAAMGVYLWAVMTTAAATPRK